MTCKWSKCKWHVQVLHGFPRRLIDPLRWNHSVPRALSVKWARRAMNAGNHQLLVCWHILPFTWPPKILFDRFSAKIRWCLFITSSSPYVPRPRVSTHARVPPPRVPTSPRSRVPRLTSHVPRPSPQVPVPLLVTASWFIVLVMWVLIGSLKGGLKVSLVRFTRKRLAIYKPPVNLEDRRVNVSRSERLRILFS